MVRGLLISLLLLPTALAVAEEQSPYSPLSPALEAISISAGDQALCTAALAALATDQDAENARRVLVLLGDSGLKAVARRLAEHGRSARETAALLLVVAASGNPSADGILACAARETRPLYRIIAADGFGRARSRAAIAPLVKLSRDPLPAVRIAALRSLFAFETPAAFEARQAVPPDPISDLLARRLHWHRRAGDASPAVLAMARTAYRQGPEASLRMAGAHALSIPGMKTPTALLEHVLHETGGGPLAAGFLRLGAGLPRRGYAPVEERRIAIDTVFALLDRKNASTAQRAAWIRLAIAWVANPVRMDSYGPETIPEHVLRQRLPDLGTAIVEPLRALLAADAFDDPRHGMILLRELGPEVALPVLRTFLAPRKTTPEFESRAEAKRRRFLRGAAAGVVLELGRLDDEALARALLLGDEPLALKVDITHALSRDPGPWVVPLLTELLEGPSKSLRKDALFVLEKRAEPEARAALIKDLFARLERPDDRLTPLLRRGDKEAVELLRRALADERSALRKAALRQLTRKRNPRLCRGAKALLLAHVPDPASPQEIEETITALLSVDPMAAVRYIDTHWDALAPVRLQTNALRLMGTITAKGARHAAIDLTLKRVPADAGRRLTMYAAAVFGGPPRVYGWDYRAEDIGPRLRAMLDSDDATLQEEALKAWVSPAAPEATARLLELLARALAGEALAKRDSTYVGEQSFAHHVIATLPGQPWTQVEPILIDVALEPDHNEETRRRAAETLIGRISAAGRTRVAAWLGYGAETGTEAPGYRAFFLIQLYLAAAVGIGADDALALSISRTLQRELWEYLTPAALKHVGVAGPKAAFRELPYNRVRALARAVSSTKHEPSVLTLLSTVFDPRLAGYAQACVQRQAALAHEAGPAAAAITPSPLHVLGHPQVLGMPWAISQILSEALVLDDDVLAGALESILSRARADGRLARFPVLYLRRVLEKLLDPKNGRRTQTADVIWRYARHMGASDGAMQYFLHRLHANDLADHRLFAQAAVVQRDLVRTIVRGNHEDRWPGLWARERAMQDAFAAGAKQAEGEEAHARRLFDRARLRAPNDPNVLNGIAWYRAWAGTTLEQAEREARRATLLEARVETKPTPNSVDTLAYILLLRGRAREGLAMLAPHMHKRGAVDNGVLHFHMAQLYAATGRLRSARDALVQALTWDRALASNVETDPFLKPVLAKQSLKAIQALAESERFINELK